MFKNLRYDVYGTMYKKNSKNSQTVKEDVDLNRIETCNQKTHDIDGQTLEVNSIMDVWAHNGN